MQEIDLLRRAAADMWNLELILNQNITDPVQLDIAAYHLQQVVEKTMKFEMSQNGVEFEWTHEIDVLINQMEDAGLKVNHWIKESASILTKYAVKTRYHSSLVAGRTNIEELLPKVKDYLEQQQCQQKLLQFVPKSNNFGESRNIQSLKIELFVKKKIKTIYFSYLLTIIEIKIKLDLLAGTGYSMI